MPPKQPAIDFKGWGVSLRISEKGLVDLLRPARSAGRASLAFSAGMGTAAVIGVTALYKMDPEKTERAIKGALETLASKVMKIRTGSIIVEVQCTTKGSFLTFMEDFETKKMKQRLEEEFQKQLEYKGELEVTIINEKEVYKELNQLRQLRVVAEKEEGVMSVKMGVGGSPVEVEMMSSKHKDLLTVSRVEIVDDLRVDDVLNFLQRRGVFDMDDTEVILSEITSRRRAERLLDLLEKKNDAAFYYFQQSLQERYPHLVELLAGYRKTKSSV